MGRRAKRGAPLLQPLQLTAEIAGQLLQGGHVGGRQGATEATAYGGGQATGLAAVDQQDVEACLYLGVAKEVALAGPHRLDPLGLTGGQVVGDQQQAGLLAGGDLLERQRHRTLGRATLPWHDGRAQVGQQQGEGLVIPGRRHGEVGIPGKQDEGDGMGRFLLRSVSQQIL